jgi:hypothetical protein
MKPTLDFSREKKAKAIFMPFGYNFKKATL